MLASTHHLVWWLVFYERRHWGLKKMSLPEGNTTSSGRTGTKTRGAPSLGRECSFPPPRESAPALSLLPHPFPGFPFCFALWSLFQSLPVFPFSCVPLEGSPEAFTQPPWCLRSTPPISCPSGSSLQFLSIPLWVALNFCAVSPRTWHRPGQGPGPTWFLLEWL